MRGGRGSNTDSGRFNNRGKSNFNSNQNQKVEYIFTPHYTGKTQHVTFDTVRDYILGLIQKTYADGTDMAQVLRAMDYSKSEVGDEP